MCSLPSHSFTMQRYKRFLTFLQNEVKKIELPKKDRHDGRAVSYYVCTRKRSEDGSDRLSSQQE